VAPALSPVRVNSRPPPFLPSSSRHVKWPLRPCTSPFLTRIVCSVRCCCSLEYKCYLLALRGNFSQTACLVIKACVQEEHTQNLGFFLPQLLRKRKGKDRTVHAYVICYSFLAIAVYCFPSFFHGICQLSSNSSFILTWCRELI
jgi:hypothetical protein